MWMFVCITLLTNLVLSDKILVLIDSWDIQESHSRFLDSISASHTLKIRMVNDPKISLSKYGEYKYDHVLFLAPSASEIGKGLNENDLLDFFDHGDGNIVLIGDTDAGMIARKLANNFGMDFHEQGTRIFQGIDEPLIRTTNTTEYNAIAGRPRGEIHFSGLGVYIKRDNELATSLIRGSNSAYIVNEMKGHDRVETPEGSAIHLAVAFQGLNNARVTIYGGQSMFNNTLWDFNGDFLKEATEWTFKQRGDLRHSAITHFSTLEGEQEIGYLEAEYTINDTLHYSIDLEERRNGEWVPFQSDQVYLEFVMLDPYIRRYLKHNGQGRYAIDFQVPDVYGVYTFKAKFNQVGYNWMDVKTQVPVRPYRHDEYERFLVAAFPYYLSIFSTVTAFVWFSYNFLSHKD